MCALRFVSAPGKGRSSPGSVARSYPESDPGRAVVGPAVGRRHRTKLLRANLPLSEVFARAEERPKIDPVDLRCGCSGHGEQRRRDVGEGDDLLDDQSLRQASAGDHHGDADQRFVEGVAVSEEGVLPEELSVIGSHDHDRVVSHQLEDLA
jgi:hypothetical protein